MKTSNSFTALASEESGDVPPPVPFELRGEKQSRVAGTSMAADATAPKPVTMLQEDFPELCKRLGVAPRGESSTLTMQRAQSCAKEQAAGAAGRLREAAAFGSLSRRCCGSTSNKCRHAYASGGLRTFLEKRTPSLRTLDSKWEKFIAILDSGASVTVVPPHLGREYEIVKGQAAADGVRYEIADGTEILNL